MRLIPTLLAALLATTALAAPAATGDAGTGVTLEVTLGNALAPAFASCALDVPAGSNGGDVLDAAVAAGCIDSWTASEFPGLGRYVTCIDGVCEQLGTFWSFEVNHASSPVGIDGYASAPGDHVEFVYTEWVSLVVLSFLP